jgi:hypothetical protein
MATSLNKAWPLRSLAVAWASPHRAQDMKSGAASAMLDRCAQLFRLLSPRRNFFVIAIKFLYRSLNTQTFVLYMFLNNF